ncbi:hypothetical protein WR25_22932 [Diploscapter pachys]|uniref:Uncharacterized protein n=1 Tax=Diploscapter pachys TaxID=2018661 RepID=A0A2A2JZ88_9BILA|nr:hypothetical protein WR25_22932 [Diploscapter pachys]
MQAGDRGHAPTMITRHRHPAAIGDFGVEGTIGVQPFGQPFGGERIDRFPRAQPAQRIGQGQQKGGTPLGRDAFGRFRQDADDATRRAAFVEDRRIIEVHPHALGRTVTIERQFLVMVMQRSARQADAHHIVVEVGDLRPALANLRSQQLRMPAAGKDRIGIVVEHDAVFAPQHHDRHRRAEQQCRRGAQALRPVANRSQRRRRPVTLSNQRAACPSAGQEILSGRAVRDLIDVRHGVVAHSTSGNAPPRTSGHCVTTFFLH